MNEFILNANKKRKKTLVFAIISAFFMVIAVIFLELSLNINENIVQEMLWKMYLLAALFICLFVVVYKVFFKPAKLKYEQYFNENYRREVFDLAFPDALFDDEKVTIDDFSKANEMIFSEDCKTEHGFSGVYEDIPYISSYISSYEGFHGLAFVFEYDSSFKRRVQIRRKGTKKTVKPEDIGLFAFETQSAQFNYSYIALAESEDDLKAMINDNALQSFLRLNEKTHARFFAAFEENKLYIFALYASFSAEPPLFKPVDANKLSNQVLKDFKIALSFAEDIKLEKKMRKIC